MRATFSSRRFGTVWLPVVGLGVTVFAFVALSGRPQVIVAVCGFLAIGFGLASVACTTTVVDGELCVRLFGLVYQRIDLDRLVACSFSWMLPSRGGIRGAFYLFRLRDSAGREAGVFAWGWDRQAELIALIRDAVLASGAAVTLGAARRLGIASA